MNILVVEDDELTAEFIKRALRQEDHYVKVIYDGLSGFDHAKKVQSYDVIIMDVMLPNKDGVSICRDLRRLAIATPIIMHMNKLV